MRVRFKSFVLKFDVIGGRHADTFKLLIGVNVNNPLQPDYMDAAAIKREFGDRLAMRVTVSTSRLWDWETPDQVRAEMRRRIQELGPEGLLLAPAYDIDYAPFDNIDAFVKAVEEFGRV